jgi:Transposase
LVAAGYQVYAINPLAAARYRKRHSVSGAKSDVGDAHVLADVVRTDRHQHRPIAGDSAEAAAVKVLARTHQRLIWDRQRQLNRLRSTLREYFPAALDAFGTDLAHPDALSVLARASTPTLAVAAKLSVSAIASMLRKGAGNATSIPAPPPSKPACGLPASTPRRRWRPPMVPRSPLRWRPSPRCHPPDRAPRGGAGAEF